MKIYRQWEIRLSVEQVLRGQGIDPVAARAHRPALLESAEWVLKEGFPLLQPAVGVVELKVEQLRHERLILESGKQLSGVLIAQHLGGAQRVAVMICTIGGQLEEISAGLLQSDPWLGMALDGYGTAAVEDLATQACAYFENPAKAMGLGVSISLSPGMVGWGVDPGQRQVFNLVDGSALGVRLNSSLMMVPRMSLTQVLGFGESLALQGRTCDFCGLSETCRYQDHYSPSH